MSVPTEPGFYWVRHNDGGEVRTEIVEVRDCRWKSPGEMWVCFMSDEYAVDVPEMVEAEWGKKLECDV